MVLDQKIVQYGSVLGLPSYILRILMKRRPFVVSSQEEIFEAMRDYQSYSNGFERAMGWKSKIGNR